MDMEDESGGPGREVESLLPYDAWVEDALRQVAVRALQHAAEQGLPGGHHFYVTFRTDFPGATLPERIREKYPQEMTIVLQHQFHNLRVDEGAGLVSVTLYFNGIATPLVIPFAAISAFADPSVQYGLRFRVVMPEAPAEPAPPETPAAESGQPQVVSLEAFRKRKD